MPPDEILDPAAAAAPAIPETPVAAPETPAEPAAPAAETTAAPAGLLAPETPAAEKPPETPAADALADGEKPAETPPAEPAASVVDPAKPTGETPPAELALETPVLQTYEPFTLPEGVVADNEAMGRFTGVIGELGLDQAGGQRLMDLYATEQTRLVEQMAQHQQRVFEETQRDWVKAFEADPEIGRNRKDTSLREANTAIRWAFGLGLPGEKLAEDESAARQAAATKYYTEMSYTGFHNHPENVRAWQRVHKLLSRYLAEPPTPQPGAPARGEAMRPADRRYGANGAAR